MILTYQKKNIFEKTISLTRNEKYHWLRKWSQKNSPAPRPPHRERLVSLQRLSVIASREQPPACAYLTEGDCEEWDETIPADTNLVAVRKSSSTILLIANLIHQFSQLHSWEQQFLRDSPSLVFTNKDVRFQWWASSFRQVGKIGLNQGECSYQHPGDLIRSVPNGTVEIYEDPILMVFVFECMLLCACMHASALVYAYACTCMYVYFCFVVCICL